jgi:hypothetical protein
MASNPVVHYMKVVYHNYPVLEKYGIIKRRGK